MYVSVQIIARIQNLLDTARMTSGVTAPSALPEFALDIAATLESEDAKPAEKEAKRIVKELFSIVAGTPAAIIPASRAIIDRFTDSDGKPHFLSRLTDRAIEALGTTTNIVSADYAKET